MTTCQCGCGEATGISKKNCTARNEIRGQNRRFRPGHNVRLRTRRDPVERFLSYVSVDHTGCWVWVGGSNQRYGLFRGAGPSRLAHRISFEMFVGPIPCGMELDHTCSNTRCVNPDHLEPVTHAENVRRYYEQVRARREVG